MAYFAINKVLLSFQESSSWKRKRPATLQQCICCLAKCCFIRQAAASISMSIEGIWMGALFLLFGARNSPRPHGVETVKRVLSNFDSKNLGAGEACLLVCFTSLPGAPEVHISPQSKNRHSVDNLNKA